MSKMSSKVDFNNESKKFEASKGETVEELPSQTQDNTFAGAVQIMSNLPTSDPTVAGQLWSNLGVLTVSAG